MASPGLVDPLKAQVDFLSEEEKAKEDLENKEIADDLTTIVSDIDSQERITRDKQLRLWKYLELLWSGSGNYYWDHFTGQWRTITQEDIALLTQDADIDPTLINKVVNVIRPYGESLVGVLTTAQPRVRFFPEDADSESDILTSKAYTNVEEKVSDDNFMNIRLMEMLVKLWNGGFAAVYNYEHQDKKYGTFHEEVKEDKQVGVSTFECLECGNESEEIDEEIGGDPNQAEGEAAPDSDLSQDEMLAENKEEASAEAQDLMINLVNQQGMESPQEPVVQDCDVCGKPTEQIQTNSVETRPVVTDTKETPKSREIINVFGPMNVKISAMAARQEHVTWLILEEEIHVAQAKHLYPKHKDKIEAYTQSDIDIDRVARTTYEVTDDTLKHHCTIRKVWLKPAEFERLEDQKKVNIYKERYPNGAKLIFCADQFLEAEEEDLDDHWTLSENPLYNRVQADPLGKALIGLHESTNDLFQLEIDTVRFSIPLNFADPQYFDFEAHRQSRSLPGSITPLKRPPGGSLSDVIADTKTATIPKEIENLDLKIEKFLQFISGVLPAVFGGPGAGSKTFGEYQESKNQALQRLSIIWKIISVLYAKVMAKATKNYVNNLQEDEKFVRETSPGNFMNVWIRKADFGGKIGDVRPELSEQFPATWGQVSSRIMEILNGGNQALVSWFLHPDNVELIYQAIGITNLKIPGEDQRNKQLYEITQMLLNEPIVAGEDQGGELYSSSSQIEPIDNHEIHMVVIQSFLNSPVGIDLKTSNAIGYQNILLHYQEHSQALMEQQAAMAPPPEEGKEEGQEGSSEPVEEV